MHPYLWIVALSLAALTACSPAAPRSPDGTRERAYRMNNVGVALLEQLKYPEAATAFREALAIDGDLGIAHLNLSLSLLYAQDYDGARSEAEEAARRLPDAPQPSYVLGLIARSQSRNDVARTQFERVRQLDPRDVGANINLAQIALEDQRYADAIAALTPVVAAEPSNVTAAYVLGLALTRSGAADEGQRLLGQAQALRRTGYAVTFGTGYLEQGRYAEGIASTGAEPDLVDTARPQVSFVAAALGPRVTAAPAGGAPPSPFGRRFSAAAVSGDARRSLVQGLAGALALLDSDGDGDLDAFVADTSGERLLRQDAGVWRDATADSGLGSRGAETTTLGAVAADIDNDGAVDLFVLRHNGSSLYRNDGRGRFTDVTAPAGISGFAALPGAAAFTDVDHDGDVDLLIAGLADVAGTAGAADAAGRRFPDDFAPAPLQLLRNNRDGTFTDITRDAGLDRSGHVIAIVPTDYDNHRDVDLLLVFRDAPPALLGNQRDGTFRDVSAAAGLDRIVGREVEVTAAAAGDVNKDDAPDVLLATSTGLVLAVSDGRGAFTRQVVAADLGDAVATQLVDYDADGLLDAIAWTGRGPRLWRNIGSGWQDVTDVALDGAAGSAAQLVSAGAWALADADGDSRVDVVSLAPDGVWLWRNSGQSPNRTLRVELAGLVSNSAGIGAKIQVRAGSLSSRAEVSATTPAVAPVDVVFGVGRRAGAEVVRVLWPSGVLQAEVAEAATAPASVAAPLPSPFSVRELDRKPSSCPFLFTWNGDRFEFVTDFLGGGEMGGWLAPGLYTRPDPLEYVRIREDQLRATDGGFALRITNELEETLFLDQLHLLVLAHPRDVSVYPNEGMSDPPKPFRLHGASGLRPSPRVRDEHGHDVTERVATHDWRAPDDFALEPIRGYAAPHFLTIDLGAETAPVLLLTAWTDYAFSSDNVAARQAGLTSQPPVLSVKTARGSWRALPVDVGLPVGRPQTIALPLAGLLRPGEHELRLSTSMRVYWDQILIGTATDTAALAPVTLAAGSAQLRIRGFSAEVRGDGRRPTLYDYGRVSPASPWKAMAGAFTREGDVRPLLTASDDQFVIARPGDEIALTFDATRLPPLPENWTRTYLLKADGFSKEMDVNSASPYTVEPLPFHRMTRYPYPPTERYPGSAAHTAYRETYNTRHVRRPWPSLPATR